MQKKTMSFTASPAHNTNGFTSVKQVVRQLNDIFAFGKALLTRSENNFVRKVHFCLNVLSLKNLQRTITNFQRSSK